MSCKGEESDRASLEELEGPWAELAPVDEGGGLSAECEECLCAADRPYELDESSSDGELELPSPKDNQLLGVDSPVLRLLGGLGVAPAVGLLLADDETVGGAEVPDGVSFGEGMRSAGPRCGPAGP